jgi:hypothetical protein
LDTVLGAYRADGFDAGYHRAVNDMLADFALMAHEFTRERVGDASELRLLLREFQDRFESHLERAGSSSASTLQQAQYVDGGLGI